MHLKAKTPPPLRVAAIQMQSGEDIRANVQLARDLLDQALERGVDLVAYPENFLINSENARTSCT
jgi:predicted amidohydrolase